MHSHRHGNMGVILDHAHSRPRPYRHLRDNHLDVNYHVGNRECEYAESELYQGIGFILVRGFYLCLIIVVGVHFGVELERKLWRDQQICKSVFVYNLYHLLLIKVQSWS